MVKRFIAASRRPTKLTSCTSTRKPRTSPSVRSGRMLRCTGPPSSSAVTSRPPGSAAAPTSRSFRDSQPKGSGKFLVRPAVTPVGPHASAAMIRSSSASPSRMAVTRRRSFEARWPASASWAPAAASRARSATSRMNQERVVAFTASVPTQARRPSPTSRGMPTRSSDRMPGC